MPLTFVIVIVSSFQVEFEARILAAMSHINSNDTLNINNSSAGGGNIRLAQVQCFPLYSILLAVGRTKVDFLSLDVEGAELQVLSTIPWHRIDIKVPMAFIYSSSIN